MVRPTQHLLGKEFIVRVIFKNMERSELAVQIVEERLQQVFEKFPRLHQSDITATLSTENSPSQAGPDMFNVRVRVEAGREGRIILHKTAHSLYAALALVCERLQDRLNELGDRSRALNRRRTKKNSKQQQLLN